MIPVSAVSSSMSNQAYDGSRAHASGAPRARMPAVAAQRLLERGAATNLSSASTALREQRLELLLRRADAMMRALSRLRSDNPESAEANVALAERFAISAAGSWAYRFSWRSYSAQSWSVSQSDGAGASTLSLRAEASYGFATGAGLLIEGEEGESASLSWLSSAEFTTAASLTTSLEGGRPAGGAISLAGDVIGAVRGGPGADAIAVAGGLVGGVRSGPGDDSVAIAAQVLGTLSTGPGDDSVTVVAGAVGEIRTGAGNDVLNLTGGVFASIDTGPGDDRLLLSARDAALEMKRGGGAELLTIAEVGALGIRVDPGLATSPDQIEITREAGRITLDFGGGDSLVIEGAQNAGAIFLQIGDGFWALSEGAAVRGADVLV